MLMHFFVRCVGVLFGGTDKTPVERDRTFLQLTAITGATAFNFKLMIDLIFTGNVNDFINEGLSWQDSDRAMK